MARLQTLLHYLGRLLHVPGLMALVSLPVCLAFGEQHGLAPLGWTAALSLGAGQLLTRVCRRAGELELRDAMLAAALAWLLVPLLGALPLWLGARELAPLLAPDDPVHVFAQPLNAVFEAFSGFTSTGLTLCPNPSGLPHVLQWWRSLMQWVGGVGVIVLMLAVVRPTVSALRLYESEARNERIGPSVASTVRSMSVIYLLYTVVGVALLWLSGAPAWESLNHGLTAIATGGFTITDGSAASLGGSTRLVLCGLMVVGAISFKVHHAALATRTLSPLWRDGQCRLLGLLLIAGSALLAAENARTGASAGVADAVFQWLSALCTAGFQTLPLAGWSASAKLLLAAGMVIGGAAGSTAGGIKLIRAICLGKGLAWRLRELTRSPHEVVSRRLGERALSVTEAEHAVEAAAILAMLWLVILVLATLALARLSPPGFALSDALLEVASAQGNVGLTTGITQPELPATGKLLLILCMWIGRLEILPAMLLLVAPFLRRP